MLQGLPDHLPVHRVAGRVEPLVNHIRRHSTEHLPHCFQVKALHLHCLRACRRRRVLVCLFQKQAEHCSAVLRQRGARALNVHGVGEGVHKAGAQAAERPAHTWAKDCRRAALWHEMHAHGPCSQLVAPTHEVQVGCLSAGKHAQAVHMRALP